MSVIRSLVKKRDISFLFPHNLAKSSLDDINYAMKAIGYFRNYPLLKTFYTLINKSFFMTLDQLKNSSEEIERIGNTSPSSSMQIDGFFYCIEKSGKDSVKRIVNTFIKPFVNNNNNNKDNRLQKSIRDYYNSGKDINIALIKSGKVYKLNTSNVVRSIYRMK